MMRLSTFLPGLLVCLLAGCGDRTIGPTDGDGNDVADEDAMPDAMDEGVVGDPWHCGESDAKCVGPMGIGECIDDECRGRLSSCWHGGTTCTDVCKGEHEDLVCAEAECEGATAYGWSLSSIEESDVMCTLADRATSTALTIGCDDPLPFDTYPGLRCCCKL